MSPANRKVLITFQVMLLGRLRSGKVQVLGQDLVDYGHTEFNVPINIGF